MNAGEKIDLAVLPAFSSEALHEEENMQESPHSLSLREDLLNAIVEKLWERADMQHLAHQVEQLVRVLRESEAQGPSRHAEFGEDHIRILMGERLAAFRMREPGMKTIDPIWRMRASSYLTGEGWLRQADEEMEEGPGRATRAAWAPIIVKIWNDLFDQAGSPPDVLIDEVLKARSYRGMSLRLAHAAWGVQGQDVEDFREKLERIAARMGPNDHLFT